MATASSWNSSTLPSDNSPKSQSVFSGFIRKATDVAAQAVHGIGMGQKQRREVVVPPLLLQPDDERDQVLDHDTFEESRVELARCGHNLTSVLMDPTDSMIGKLLENAAEESVYNTGTFTSIFPSLKTLCFGQYKWTKPRNPNQNPIQKSASSL